jgi:hypothetical protein
VDGAQSDQLLVLRLEREGVEHSVKIPRMHGIELRMQNELSEARAREPGLLDQSLDRVGPRMVRLELQVPEDGDRVVVEDPEVLRADERGHLRRRQPRQECVCVHPECFEILASCAAGLVTVRFLPNVPFQLFGESRGDRIVVRKLARPLHGNLHKRDHRAREGVTSSQIPRQ